jgi:methionine synthase II (cobalamin-independent)
MATGGLERNQVTPASRLPLPFGLSTSIGSLPHADPSEAVDFVLRHQPRLPAAPTLPAHSGRELMLAQAAAGVRGITVADDGSFEVRVDDLDPDDPLEDCGFAGDAWVGLRAFLNAVADRTDPVKFQLTGPVTFGIALHASGVPTDLAFATAAAAVRTRADALIDMLDVRLPQCLRVVFLDEPGLTGALERSFPIATDAALDLVSGVLAPLERSAITGIHCCGPADWKLVMEAGPQVLSLPLESEVEAAAGSVAQYLERGGWIAWGVVPTDRPLGTTPESLWRQLSELWCRLVQDGCDPVKLRTQAMITPACGLAGHGITQAEQVMEFCTELAERLHDQAIGVRLSVGA